MTLDNTLYWKNHIDQLLPKLSSAWYTISVFKQIMLQETFSNGRLCLFSLNYELWYYFLGVILLTASIFIGCKKK